MSQSSRHTSRTIKFNTEDFKVFLECLSNISDTAILNVENDKIWSIVSSDDRRMVLMASLEGDFDLETTLNLPSLRKLSRILDMVSKKTATFTLNSNNLEFKDDSIRVKYHLYGDGILAVSPVSRKKIESLQFDYEFNVEKTFVSKLLKNSSVFKDTNKLYVFTDGGKLVWSLADKTMMNTDIMTAIGDDVDFEMDEEFIMSIDNVRLLNLGNCVDIPFRIGKIGVGSILLNHGNVELNYILSGLEK